jgi:prepilin-type N-terminal cleavage/methylation domain-containing protein
MMRRRRPASPGSDQAGFTLVEMMITALVSGLLMVVVARLFLGTYKGWLFNYSALIAQQKARIYRDAVNKNLRQASASTIQISRQDNNQPVRSKLTFTDAAGKNWAFFQYNNEACMESWPSTGAFSLSQRNRVIPAKVERLVFYYPDIKDLRKVAYSLDLEWTLLADNQMHPITIQMVGQVDVRDP